MQAQPQSLSVKMIDCKRFVELTSDNVNFRRLPNAQSGKLMEWNSDGGSFETYTILFFSDTERGKYRVGGLAGAFNSQYLTRKGYIYPVLESRNGWYCVEVQGQKNTKKAWVNGNYCKEIIVSSRNSSKMVAPIYSYYDEATQENKNSPSLPILDIFPFKATKYQKIPMTYEFNPHDNCMCLLYHFFIGDFCVLSRQRIFVDTNKKEQFELWEVKEESEMGDDYVSLMFSMRSGLSTLVKTRVFKQCFQTWGNDKVGLIVRNAFPENGKVSSGEVCFIGEDGKQYYYSFDRDLPTFFNVLSKTISLY